MDNVPEIDMDLFLDPPCRPSTLDSFANRRMIVNSLRGALPGFSGVVLDVGCGRKPYRDLLLSPPSQAERYIGLDLADSTYGKPDVAWDGKTIPLPDASAESCLLTEVLEHCPDPQFVLGEIRRVLTPRGYLFMTVPFIWPMHDVPHDEFRYTPFSLHRMLVTAGFADIQIEATGGRDAVLAVVLGLWVRRRATDTRIRLAVRKLLSVALWPVVWFLMRIDRRPASFAESTMVVGLAATARKPK